MIRIVSGLLAASVLLPAPAEAIWVELTEPQVQEAVAHGKTTYESWRAAGRSIDDLDPEYVTDPGRDIGRAFLFTEFSALALETRRWLAIGQQLKPEDITSILSPLRGRLQIAVVVVGPNREFLRHHAARLEQGGTSHEPLNWDIFRGTEEAGAPGRWVAPAQYTFSARDLDPTVPVTLVLRDQTGHEIRFAFDLSRLR